MSFPVLTTNRLRLVQVEKEHAPGLFKNFTDPRVLKYYGSAPMANLQQAENMVDHFKTTYDAKRGIRWAIILAEGDHFIGTIGLNQLSLGMKRAEVGFEIHPDFWRGGLTSEALIAVLNYSFSELQLNRMGAVTFLDNKASVGLLEKHGFQKEGVLRKYLFQDGAAHDGNLFSLLKDEWNNS